MSKNDMNILSIHDGHNASAAIFKDQNILSCVSEERLNRDKFYSGWPELSIIQVLKESGISLEDIDVVTVSHLDSVSYILRKIPLLIRSLFSLSPKLFLGHLYNIGQAIKREIKIRHTLSKGKKKKFFFCDHHIAHAASAHFFSGFSNSTTITIDYAGDSLSHTAYKIENGTWTQITRGYISESIGAFYAALTESLGFKPNRHEGKIVGLAAFGKAENIPTHFREKFLTITSDKLHFKRKKYHEMVQNFKELLRNGYTREDISAFGQDILETVVIEHIKEVLKKTGINKVALAGGVFSNVKLNQKIAEQCNIEGIFVQPAMGDEGLVLGSPLYFLHTLGFVLKQEPMSHVYLSNEYSDDYIVNILKQFKMHIVESGEISEKVARLLGDNKIIGWFDGKMEFGPRALGHRSMMINPARKEVNDEVNRRLHRSEFMPFAPSVLAEEATNIFSCLPQAMHTAEFMTITFNVKEDWRDKIKAVVHIDNTARPQLVTEKINKPYYDVIKKFYEITGIPLVVNTSFNMHEEPIVCSPEDALKSFQQGAVDYVVFNNRFIVAQDTV